MKLIYFLVPLAFLCFVAVASATITVSPADPIINGNGYVFITFNDSSYDNQTIHFNITDPGFVAKTTSTPTCNEYGFARVKYNFTSSDISGTWHYETNTTDGNGSFEVGKITINLSDRDGNTVLEENSTTVVSLDLGYENLLPKEISVTYNGYDFGNFRSECSPCDVDGDGETELFFQELSGTVIGVNYTNMLEGFHTYWRTADFGTSYYAGSHVFADFDGDGNQTLFVVSYEGRLYAFANVSMDDGTSVAYSWQSSDEGTYRNGPCVLDIENDGTPDMLVTGTYEGYVCFWNYSDATGFTLVDKHGDEGTFHYNNEPVPCDMDDDGDNEIIIVEYNGGAIMYEIYASNHTSYEVDEAPDRGGYYAYGSAIDFDKDGKTEYIFFPTTYRAQMLQYNKSGTQELEEDIVWADDDDYGGMSAGSAAIVRFEDLNLNGRPDFVVAGGGDTPVIGFYEYDPSDGGWYQEAVGNVVDRCYTPINCADFDGDGLKEFVVKGYVTGNVYVYRFNGSGFEVIYEGWNEGKERDLDGDGARYCGDPGSGFYYGETGIVHDFDNDGKDEFVVAMYGGGFLVYEEEDRYEQNVTPALNVVFNLTNGSYINPYTEVRILNDSTLLGIKSNVAAGQTDCFDDDGQNQGNINPRWTDGILSTDSNWIKYQEGVDFSNVDSSLVEEESYTVIDLQRNYTISLVKTWHCFEYQRNYFNVILRSTTDSGGDFTVNNILFDNSDDGNNERYAEAIFGKSIYFHPIEMRYLRDSTAGCSRFDTVSDNINRRTEIEIYETEIGCNYTILSNEFNDTFYVNVTVADRTGNIVNATYSLNYSIQEWNYSQNLSWKILNLTDTTILKLSEDGNLAIAGQLYELTNTPPPGDTVAFQIADNLWLTESGDMYVKENLHEETNVINIIMVLMFINMLGYAMYKKMRKRDR